MKSELINIIHRLNPWLADPKQPMIEVAAYRPRIQAEKLLSPAWDKLCLILTGPRQAGKSTLGKYLCFRWLQDRRFNQAIYLNCDLLEIRQWLKSVSFLDDIEKYLHPLKQLIIFIDEVQRLENPGLLLKAIIDLKLPIKLLASGSSQLELKSHVQEHLTGRQLESLILPFSYTELSNHYDFEQNLIYGCYPQITQEMEKPTLLKQLYDDYINKDIIAILKISRPDVIQQLMILIAHGSGQLVNYQQLATDCRVSTPTIQHYLSILEKTYVLAKVRPYVGNKRQEITSNPIYYYLDNGFRNQSLHNFSPTALQAQLGLLIQSAVFQEIYKFKAQNFQDFDIHYWRTKGGAEVDFILAKGIEKLIPIEVKFRNQQRMHVTRGLRSFIEAYQPQQAFVISKNLLGELQVDGCHVHFIPFIQLNRFFELLNESICK